MSSGTKISLGWNLSLNPTLAFSLRKAIDANELFPLAKLVRLHAGEIVNRSGIRIEAFYAQDWAFARYLWEGENGKYRPALQRLLADTAAGTVYDPTGSHQRNYVPWKPAAVQPMLEHYLGESLSQTDCGYQIYIHEIAQDEIKRQFGL